MIMEDLKASVALKINVAEDLQGLLKQSQAQYNDAISEAKGARIERDFTTG